MCVACCISFYCSCGPLPKAAGYILLCFFVVRVGEDLACLTFFQHFAQVEEACLLANTGGLLHGVSHDDDGIVLAQFVDQFLDLRSRNRVEC